MLKKIFLGASLALFLGSCNSDDCCKTGAKNGAGNADASKAANHFGAAITSDNAITYDELLNRMASTDSLPAKVTGKVSEVCQKKGCWMTLVSDQPGKPDMRVTFKDYAFFMPKDIVGKKVVIDGYALVETTPVNVLRHYAEDAHKSQSEIDAIKEPKREMSFEAAGVLIAN
jgi:hypothetical protein